MIKKIIRFGWKAAGICYYLTLGKLFWLGSTLSIHKKKGFLIPCPSCGNTESNLIFSVPVTSGISIFDERSLARNIYNLDFIPIKAIRKNIKEWEIFTFWPQGLDIDYHHCRKCDIFFQNAPVIPEAESSYYAQIYRSTKKLWASDSCLREIRLSRWAEYLKKKTTITKGARVLDIGSCEGYLLYKLKKLGFDVYGIEPSLYMANFSREYFSLPNVKTGEYSKDAYPEKHFDLINASHVIEHINDHKAFLDAAFTHLKSGGYLVISTPCIDSILEISKRGAKACLDGVFSGLHHVLFSSTYLSKILETEGFVLQSTEIIDSESQLLPDKKISASGEKWLGMNMIARKP